MCQVIKSVLNLKCCSVLCWDYIISCKYENAKINQCHFKFAKNCFGNLRSECLAYSPCCQILLNCDVLFLVKISLFCWCETIIKKLTILVLIKYDVLSL